jgi:prepilin-type N-terminal cleavage/methylation domain-containing protein
MRSKIQKGISIIEVLVVIMVFSVLSILATQSIVLSLRGSQRSEATIGVRENINYSLAVIERQLHNAESVDCGASNATTITYTDELSQVSNFTCDLTGGFIASSSARLTGGDIDVTACTFSCNSGAPGVPGSVTISITAQDTDATGIEVASFTTNTQILLRTY